MRELLVVGVLVVLLSVFRWTDSRYVAPTGSRSRETRMTMTAVFVVVVLAGGSFVEFMPTRVAVAVVLAVLAGHVVEAVETRRSDT